MEGANLLSVLQQMLYMTVVGVTLILLPSLVIGLIVAIFQAATQINEMTLSFLPKLLVILLIVALYAPWLFHQIVSFTQKLIMDIPFIVG